MRKVVVDVVESLLPGACALLLDLDDLDAKAAPEAVVAVSTDSTTLHRSVLLRFFLLVMVLDEMVFEGLATVADFAAEVTLPHLQLKVLTVLVPLPVILGSKGLGTLREGAAVRSCVAFQVLPTYWLATR